METLETILKKGFSNDSGAHTGASLPDEIYEHDCPHCDDMLVVSLDVAVGDPRFGKAYPCLHCRGGRELYERRLKKTVMGSGLAGEYAGYTFDTWDSLAIDAVAGKWLARHVASEILEYGKWTNPETGFSARGIIFAGEYGRGKTGLMAALANGMVARKREILWINAQRLWKAYTATWEKNPDLQPDYAEWQLRQTIKDVDVLFVDDFNFKGEAPPTAVDFFTGIIRTRHDFGKVYFATTNHLDPKDFQAEWGRQMCEVVFQNCHWIVMDGGNLRQRTEAAGG